MKRKQLFEFEDFHWIPSSIRAGMTNLLIAFGNVVKADEAVFSRLNEVKKEIPFDQIVDLGSGSGGIMPKVAKKLGVKLVLTDLYPNPKVVSSFNEPQNADIRYEEKSVDATHFETAPRGFKTMINSFHHMPVPVAKKILASAQKNREGILIYELAENNIPFLVWLLLLPISIPILMLMAVFLTLQVKKCTWQQIVFTFIIPIIPFMYAFDGQTSLMRIYSFKDIENDLLGDLPKEDSYVWRIEKAFKENGKQMGYTIIGQPK
ncbi:MAG: class I SAM-dependent methyltransferase [Flavobacteriales bacterium]|jgi:hypothetical protein|nr:class I SAM-dependent methyltransferase [Flavobacteriales bacterium]